MHYQFPVIRTIDDVLPHIDEDHFRVVDKEGITYINYNSLVPSTFPEITKDNYLTAVIRRECRGIAFDTASGEIVSRPFHKFFNMGERPDAQFVDDHHELLEKLDGSMIRPLPYKSGIRLGTKMGVTDIAMKAEEFIADKKNYWEFIDWAVGLNCTPIFEYLGPYNRVVMEYEEDMVLLAFRINDTGTYIPLLPNKYNVPIVQTSKHPLEAIKERDDQEGVVIRYSNGHMLKIKTDWYVKAHRAKELLTSDRRFLEAILNESIDDAIPTFLPEDQERVRRKLEVFENNLQEACEFGDQHYSNALSLWNGSKKDYAIETADLGNNLYRRLAFQLWDGKIKSAREGIMNMLERATLSQKNYEEVMSKLRLFDE